VKILVVQESDWIKRNPHQQHHLMERLSLKGHEIKVIDYPIDWKEEKGLYKSAETIENYHKIHPEANIDVIRPGILKLPLLVYPSVLFSHRREIKHQIKEFKPDVIIGFGIINTYLASKVAKKENIPFIYYWIDVIHLLIPEKSLQAFGEYLERATISNSTQVLTINRKLEEYVRDLGAKNTKVIGAGIDLEKFDLSIDGNSIRQKHGIKDDDIVLFFMGFLYHFAGLKEVALELVKDKYENVKLLIVGDGDAYQDLQDIVEEHDLGERVLLVGRKPYNEIPAYTAASDICILPAYPDEIIMQNIVPIKLYEYMAMAKPVITTTLPGIMKEFGNENGILYVNEPSEVPEKALDVDIGLEGNKARQFAELCDWKEISYNFENELKEIILNG
jgi:glycosyltransferase involved in cell wall biosynthesis